MTSTNDSPTKVNPPRSHGVGLWNNKRKVVGIRVDENLYEAFKPVAKRVFGSVCRPIEAFMASVIALAETGVNFGETVKIGHLHIERNLRPRRLLRYDELGANKFDPSVGWTFESDAVLNDNGHAINCVCKTCRGSC